MLSILIPIYNFSVKELVTTLHQQGVDCTIPFEIICFDDGSKPVFKKENQIIQSYPFVSYKELPQNLGRAKIRNALARAAAFPYLLFMDCDSKVNDPKYLSNYVQHLNAFTLLYGGRNYSKNPPGSYLKTLHFRFGKNREETLTEERKISPYYSFMTNNFVIPKAIFLDILFEESIEGYGHEDTLFGLELKQKKVTIQHINNPLEHIGLENNLVFLQKQKNAVLNLWQIYHEAPLIETKLLNTLSWCKKWKIDRIVYFTLRFIKPIIDKQLLSKHPRLFFLDLYKLQYLLELDKNGINNLSS